MTAAENDTRNHRPYMAPGEVGAWNCSAHAAGLSQVPGAGKRYIRWGLGREKSDAPEKGRAPPAVKGHCVTVLEQRPRSFAHSHSVRPWLL